MSSPNESNIPRAAVIGLGGFGVYQAKALTALAADGLCHFVAGCDPNRDSLKDRQGLALRDDQLFRSCEEMLAAEKLDYVVIASPPHLHEEQVRQALDHGAFVYLEKPPVPTLWQLNRLLTHPRSNRVAVGFQMLESMPLSTLKRKLASGELGRVEEISASGLWARSASYYQRAAWAGRMDLGRRTVFDGPLTNALAHIVHNVFFLAGVGKSAFAVPRTVSGFYARARPIESYDFAWIKGVTGEGIPYNIVGGHCVKQDIPWLVSVRTVRGIFSIEEADVPGAGDLLVESHRSALEAWRGTGKATTTLADCLGYSLSTSGGLMSSLDIHAVPSDEIELVGAESESLYHVERIYRWLQNARQSHSFSGNDIPWMKCGKELDCREALVSPSPLFQNLLVETRMDAGLS